MSWRSITLIILSLITGLVGLSAQVWAEFRQIQGPGAETIDRMSIAPDGAVCIAGTFNHPFAIENASFTSVGAVDLYIASFEPTGGLKWAKSGGSMLVDEVSALTTDVMGNVIVAGTYWFEAYFDALSLSAEMNPKGIFLLKLDPQGEVVWGIPVHGTGLKGVGALGTDDSGNVWLSGFFGGQLLLGDTSLLAAGTTDFFLAKFSSQGEVLWSFREGLQGDTRATVLHINGEGMATVGGFFNNQTVIAGSSFTANTLDRDVFIAAYDTHGQSLWARKAGGVHDDDIAGLDTDEQGNVYASGYFVGVMSLGEGLSIQSATGNPDFFLLKYNSNGVPLKARALGGPMSQLVTNLSVQGGIIALCGYFQGTMAWDGFILGSNGPFAGFFSTFNTDLEGVWAQALSSSQGLFPQQIVITPDGYLRAAGSFSGSALFPPGLRTASGTFDGFLLGSMNPVAVEEPVETSQLIAFPNPTPGILQFTGLNPFAVITVLDLSGNLCAGPFSGDRIELNWLPDGIYVLQIWDNVSFSYLRIVKLRP